MRWSMISVKPLPLGIFLLVLGYASCLSGCMEEEQQEMLVNVSTNGDLPHRLEGNSQNNSTCNDSDGDGVYDFFETENGTVFDTDGDRIVDMFDIDDDEDGILTIDEHPTQQYEGNPVDALDTDEDGIPNYLDADDDNDSIFTQNELADSATFGNDTDGDDIPNYLDFDSDNDSILDQQEGMGDSDGDGIPNYLDFDSDNDGIPDQDEGMGDSDGDGIPNYLDSSDDGLLGDLGGDFPANTMESSSDSPPSNDPHDSPDSSDDLIKFLGSWHNMDNLNEHWIFYGNGSIRKSTIEINENTNESYNVSIWFDFFFEDTGICFKDKYVFDIEATLCYDYVFSTDETMISICSEGIPLFTLERD